jgi:hypothetical protein
LKLSAGQLAKFLKFDYYYFNYGQNGKGTTIHLYTYIKVVIDFGNYLFIDNASNQFKWNGVLN